MTEELAAAWKKKLLTLSNVELVNISYERDYKVIHGHACIFYHVQNPFNQDKYMLVNKYELPEGGLDEW